MFRTCRKSTMDPNVRTEFSGIEHNVFTAVVKNVT